VYKLPNGKWRAVKVVGYYIGEDGKKHKKAPSRSDFATKREAVDYLPLLGKDPQKKELQNITFKALYDKWLPTHEDAVSKSTINCYKAAVKYFEPVWFLPIRDIDVDDLQECVDACEQGKRTRRNMKTVCGLVYKHGIPRNCIPENLNLAEFLRVGDGETVHKRGFTDAEIKLIKEACGVVEYADYIYCLIYLGFRPGEFLTLDVSRYDRKGKYIVGGAKTEAGKDRCVTISPKIQPIINDLIKDRISGALFPDKATGAPLPLRRFREDCFYPALEAAGIEKPKEKRLTPHSCRHTFATLMKNVKASDKDKLKLIGHTSEEMLRYYQDVSVEDLRKITSQI